jgi:hypothetical protein
MIENYLFILDYELLHYLSAFLESHVGNDKVVV